MLGHPIKELRDAAVIALNIIYDGVIYIIYFIKIQNIPYPIYFILKNMI